MIQKQSRVFQLTECSPLLLCVTSCPSRSALFSLVQLWSVSTMTLLLYYNDTDKRYKQRAASGTQLRCAVAQLVETWSSTRMAANSSSDLIAAVKPP